MRLSAVIRGTALAGARGLSSEAAGQQPRAPRRRVPADAPDLRGFMIRDRQELAKARKWSAEKRGQKAALRDKWNDAGAEKSYYLETYGCQMNEADSQVVESVLSRAGLVPSPAPEGADVVLLNTCAVRDNAEAKVWSRLNQLRGLRNRGGKRDALVGVLGCMAERLKDELLDHETLVNFIAGPDAYRDLPRLMQAAGSGQQAMNVQLSLEETYADIVPVRPQIEGISAYISIMRGCNNMCSFCVVPFTRGRERSRTLPSIEDEVRALSDQGYKEVTLLGQNVNSYWDQRSEGGDGYRAAPGFSNVYKLREGGGARFVDLLDAVSRVDPQMRVRFTSPHPKDFPPEVLQLIGERSNICNQLHMPAQSGSSSVLERMRRGYTRESFLSLIEEARTIIPNVAISTDMISGFCGETEEEHRDSVTLMEKVGFDQAFMFSYSERSKTHASHTMRDDVSDEDKLRRLQEVIDAFRGTATQAAEKFVGTEQVVLLEGESKRSTKESPQLAGRSDANKVCVWEPKEVPGLDGGPVSPKPGDYVRVKVLSAGTGTLYVEPLGVTRL